MRYATSTDGGVLWSSLVDVVNWGREYVDALQVATNATGAGAAVTYLEFASDKAVRVARFSPQAWRPSPARKFRGGRVQVRSVCDDQKLTLVVEAATGNRQVAPGTILRRASFGRRTQGARRVFRRPFRARYVLRRRHARIPVRVVPRRGKARTLRLKRARAAARTPDAQLNAANVLTLVRIALIPVLAALLLSTLAESDLLAAIVFVIASATDALDGWLARRRSEVTHVRQADGPARRQAADHLRARLARRALPARRLGRDGDHRARVRGHRPAHAGDRAGPGHLRQRAGASSRPRRRSRWCWR